jgi:hypothetical protein
MCIMPKSQAAPPPPAPVELPKPEMAPMVSAPQMQTAPASPASRAAAADQSAVIRRRGKRGMIIQMGSTAGTNLPGA